MNRDFLRQAGLHALISCVIAAALGQAPVSDGSRIRGANLPSMPVGQDDLLQVTVYESPELSGSVRLDDQGEIFLPMVKSPIKAQGCYPKDLEARIAAALVDEHLIVRPIVTVTVLEYRSLAVTVTGAVRQPITFQAYGTVNLLDALVRAQGASGTAGDEVLVSTPGNSGKQGLMRHVPIRELMSGNYPELNLLLHGGEEIRVVEQGHISIVGNVRKPGLYPVHSGDVITLLNAIAESEGLLPYASKRAYIYRLEDAKMGKREIPVELSKIMSRKAQDIPLMAGDILYIPDDHTRRATLGTLDKLLTAGSGAGTALVYAGIH